MSKPIMVTIICLAYNHEKFIRQTLDGFVNQKTSFAFEVIVHDDASTDDSAKIIKEYEERYPQIIKPIYQKENQYSRKVKIVREFIFPLLKGKYVAWCEGDDYWIDENKLQMQVDALESNSNCVACISKVEKVSFDGQRKHVFFPANMFSTGVIFSEEYMEYTLSNSFAWQISGLVVDKNIYTEYKINPPDYVKFFRVGDIPMFLYVGLKGDVYYIDNTMSCYRTGNPNSWIGRKNRDISFRVEYNYSKIEAFNAFDIYTHNKYHHIIESLRKKLQFAIYLDKCDLKLVKSEEMKEYYNKLSAKQKAKLYLFHYLPWLEKPIRKIWAIIKRNK